MPCRVGRPSRGAIAWVAGTILVASLGGFPVGSSAAWARGHGPVAGLPLRVEIAAPREGTEPGVPLGLSSQAIGGVPPYQFRWADSTGSVGIGANWTVTPNATGNLTVIAFANDSAGAVAAAIADLTVVPGPLLSIAAPPASLTPSNGFLLHGSVGSGFPPYRIGCSEPPLGPVALTSVASSGPFACAVPPSQARPSVAEVSVTDALGGAVNASVSLAPILVPPISLAVSTGASRLDAGMAIPILLFVSGGAAPIFFSVDSASPLANETSPSGWVPANGTARWQATALEPGNLTLRVGVQDASGQTAETTTSLAVAPPLAAFLSERPGPADPNGGIPFAFAVSGGTPPYDWTLMASGGDATTGNLSDAGTRNASLVPMGAGSFSATLSVRDAVGQLVVRSLIVPPVGNLTTPSPEPAPPGTGPVDGPTAIGATLVALVLGGGLLLLVVRRRRTPSRADPEEGSAALEEVRRLLQASDGIDRATLGVLADEAGLSSEAVDRALERWRSAGRVQADDAPGSEGRLRWTEVEELIGTPEVRP